MGLTTRCWPFDWLLTSNESERIGSGVSGMGKIASDTIWAGTMSEARHLAGQRRFWAGLLGAGFVIGLTGPFGTYDTMSTIVRLSYWLVVTAATFWLGYLVSFAVVTGAENHDIRAPLSLGIGAVSASVPVTGCLAGLHMIVFGTPFWADALILLPYVAVISIALAAVSEALGAHDVEPIARPTPNPDPAWLDQLPNHLGKDLILLNAQDHYVKAETELGQTLIRTTLQEAAHDLGDHGVRLHRSWWVARNAVKAYRYRNGSPVVVLRNDRELPVGRTYRRSVKEALR